MKNSNGTSSESEGEETTKTTILKKREGKEGKNWKLKLMSLWTMHEKNKTRENE
jgi:hypothetical protein